MGIFEKLAQSLAGSKESSLDQIETPSDQTPEEVALVTYIRQKIDLVRQTNQRIAQEGVVFTNIAYLLGYNQITYDTASRQFRNNDPKRRITRTSIKINKILPTVQNRLARLCQNPPKYDVRPNSNSSQDKDCARLGLQVIDDIFDKQNFKEKQQDLLMNCMQAGVGYVQVMWDPSLGKPMPNGEYEGDVRLEVLNFFEVFPDPLAKTLDDAQWIIKAKVRKLDYFRERYERGYAVKEEDVWLLSSLYDLKTNAASGVGIAGSSANQQMQNSAIECVLYERRSKDHPNGRMCVMANGILLEDKELPVGELDIVKFDDILIGGRYHSEAIITHLRPIQDQYTILRTKCAEWIKQLLAGKYIVAKGAGLGQESLNNDTEVLEANPVAGWNGPVVQPLMLPQIPQYAYEDIATLDKEFDFVSGINEASRGEGSSTQSTFRGQALLVEQNQTRISVQTNRNEVGYAKIGSLILKYVGKYYEMPRLIKNAGDGLEYTVKEFKGSELNDNYDVIVMPGSTVPGSKVLKRQDLINLYQMGILGNPQDPKVIQKLLKNLEFGDINEVWKEQALNEQQVKKVIAKIESGELPQPIGHEWDDHVTFIRELNEYRKTDKYEEMSPEQQGMINYVAEWHLNAQTALLNPQIPQQQMMAQHMVNTMNDLKAQNGGMLPAPDAGMQPPPEQASMPAPPQEGM